MNKNEYLEDLESTLKSYNIKDYLEIVEKYRKRFELAHAAGMSEEEAIKMMGSVFSVCKKYLDEEDATTYFEIYNLKVDDALAEEIIISKTDQSGITINVDEDLADRLNINHNDKKITISDRFGRSLFRKTKGRILIEVGPNVKFDNFEISTISCDVKICEITANKYNLKTVSGDYRVEKITADASRLSSVSGDFDISRIKVKEFRLSTVSGDADIEFADIENAIFDTISGDINVTGRIMKKRGSCISGNINYKEISI